MKVAKLGHSRLEKETQMDQLGKSKLDNLILARLREETGKILPLILVFGLVFQLIVGYFLGQAVTNRRLMDYEEINLASDYLAKASFHYLLKELAGNPDLVGIYDYDDYYQDMLASNLGSLTLPLIDTSLRVRYEEPFWEISDDESNNLAKQDEAESGEDNEGNNDDNDLGVAYQWVGLNIDFYYDDLDFPVRRKIRALVSLDDMRVLEWSWRLADL